VDLRHNCGYIEILDKQVDYHFGCDIASIISCYNPKHLEDILNRTQASAPDKPTTAVCSMQ